MSQVESRATVSLDNAIEAACPSQPARHLLSIIRRYSRKKGFCFAGQRWLAEQMGCCERTCLRELEALELIETRRSWFDGRNRNTYRPLQPANVAGYFAGSKRQDLPVGPADFAGSTYETGTEEGNNNKTAVVEAQKSAEKPEEVPSPATTAESPQPEPLRQSSADAEVERIVVELERREVRPDTARDLAKAMPQAQVQATLLRFDALHRLQKFHTPGGVIVEMFREPAEWGIKLGADGWEVPDPRAAARRADAADKAATDELVRAIAEKLQRLRGGASA